MRACWLKWVGWDWSISADYIWLIFSDANTVTRRKAAARMLKGIHAQESREACGRKAGEVADELESMRPGTAARTVRC